MTTQREVKALLKPIIARHDDLLAWPRGFLLKPIRHVVRGVLLSPTSTADRFDLQISVVHAFLPDSWLLGVAMQPVLPGWIRSLSDPAIREKLATYFDTALLPLLRQADTLDRLRELACTQEFFDLRGAIAHPFYQVHIDAALGNFDTALETCASLAGHKRRGARYHEPSYARVMDELRPLLEADDRTGVAALLRGWEVENMQRLGLESIYEPTPFPLELQSP